jgi:hypothetical protein
MKLKNMRIGSHLHQKDGLFDRTLRKIGSGKFVAEVETLSTGKCYIRDMDIEQATNFFEHHGGPEKWEAQK